MWVLGYGFPIPIICLLLKTVFGFDVKNSANKALLHMAAKANAQSQPTPPHQQCISYLQNEVGIKILSYRFWQAEQMDERIIPPISSSGFAGIIPSRCAYFSSGAFFSHVGNSSWYDI
jgi:hypothetical protein